MYWIGIIVSVLCLIGFLVWASADIGSRVYLKTFCRAEASKDARPRVALTFDDGPSEQMTAKVLDVLRKHGVKATFFLIGRECEAHPELVRRIDAEGHSIGSHTYSHNVKFTYSSCEEVKKEIDRSQDAIYSIIGRRVRLFRPPFGVTNPNIGAAVRGMGLVPVGWSIRSLDTVQDRPRIRVLERVLRRLHDGGVILLHDRCSDADVLLDQLISALHEKGYEIVDIGEFLKTKIYED